MSKRMKIDDTIKIGVGLSGFVVGLIGIGYSLANRKRLDHICNKLNTTIDDMTNTIDVDIPELIIEKAINKAIDSAVNRAAYDAAKSIGNSIQKEIKTEVEQLVKTERDHISESVTKQISVEIAKIDMKALTKIVREDARDLIVKKFDGNLDDLLEQYNNRLDSITQVYSSIAKRFTGDSYNTGKDLKISLG